MEQRGIVADLAFVVLVIFRARHEEDDAEGEAAIGEPAGRQHELGHVGDAVAPWLQIGVLLDHVDDGLGAPVFSGDDAGDGILAALRGWFPRHKEAKFRRRSQAKCLVQGAFQWPRSPCKSQLA